MYQSLTVSSEVGAPWRCGVLTTQGGIAGIGLGRLLGREHASTPQSGVEAPRLLKRSLPRLYCCCCCRFRRQCIRNRRSRRRRAAPAVAPSTCDMSTAELYQRPHAKTETQTWLSLVVVVVVVVVVLTVRLTYVSVHIRPQDAPNWVAEHLGASSRRPRHPFPALMAAVYLCTRPHKTSQSMSANCGASTVYCTVSTIPGTCRSNDRHESNVSSINVATVGTRPTSPRLHPNCWSCTTNIDHFLNVLQLEKLNDHGNLPLRHDRDVDDNDGLQLRRLHSLQS